MDIKQRIIAELLRLGFAPQHNVEDAYNHQGGGAVYLNDFGCTIFDRNSKVASISFGFPEAVIFAALQEAAK